MIPINRVCIAGATLLAIALPSSRAFAFTFTRDAARTLTHNSANLDSASEDDAVPPSRDSAATELDHGGHASLTSRRVFASTAAVGISSTLFAVAPAQAIGLPSLPSLPSLPFSSKEDTKSETATEEKNADSATAATAKDESSVVAAAADDSSDAAAVTADAEESPRPPGATRVLVLGGTGTVGREVVKKLAALGIYAVATSRDGRDGTIALDVLDKKTGTIAAVTQLADDNRATAVISCLGAVADPPTVGLVNGAVGLAAIGARNATAVRRFVALGVSPAVARADDDLKGYFAGKAFSEECVTAQFKGEGYSYTIVQPSAMLDAGVVADAAIAGAVGYEEHVLDTNDKIAKAAKQVASLIKT